MTDDLKDTIKAAIKLKSPNYLPLRSIIQKKPELLATNDQSKEDSKTLQESAYLLTDKYFSKYNNSTRENWQTTLLKDQNILLIRHQDGLPQVYTVDNYQTPLLSDTSLDHALTHENFEKIIRSFQAYYSQKDSSELDESRLYELDPPFTLFSLAYLRYQYNKKFTKPQIATLYETFPNAINDITCDIIHDEYRRLNLVKHNNLFVLPWIDLNGHVARKRGIISLETLLEHHSNTAIDLSLSMPQRRQLVIKIVKATNEFRINNIAHNAVCAQNIAIDIDDNNEVEVFLKNTLFSLDTPPSNIRQNYPEHYKFDREQLLTVIQQVMLGCKKAEKISQLLTVFPDIQKELKAIKEQPFRDLTKLIDFLETKSHQLNQLESLKTSTDNEVATIATVKKELRASPTPEETSQSIVKLLNFENLAKIKSDKGKATAKFSPRTLFSEEPLSPKIKHEIKKAISPKITHKKKPKELRG